MNDPEKLWQGGPVMYQSGHFLLGTDTVLLADFTEPGARRNGIDLGCGSGALPLLLMTKSERLNMTGIELDPDAADCARLNMTANGLSERCRIVTGDIRRCREYFASGEFELCVANPPYFPAGSGKSSPDPARAAAREETQCTLSELCAAAAYLTRTGGAFCLVHRAERMTDVLCTLRGSGLEPKRLRLVAHDITKPPSLILVDARRGAAPGLTVLPTLYLHEPDGRETAETLRIYHREETP